MRQERLLEALSYIGDDLLWMAEHSQFANPWKKWGSLAACLALVLSLTVLALPYFPIGCGAAEGALPEEIWEEALDTQRYVEEQRKDCLEQAETIKR